MDLAVWSKNSVVLSFATEASELTRIYADIAANHLQWLRVAISYSHRIDLGGRRTQMDGGDQSVSMLVTEAQTGGAGQAGGGGDEDRLRRGCRQADQALSSPVQWSWLVSERLETFYKRDTAQFLSVTRSGSFLETK